MKKDMTLENFLADLDGGIFEIKTLEALKDTALHVVETGKKGKVVIELTLSRISESSQITVLSKLKADTPKPKGRIIEENETETPMYVTAKGVLTPFPQHQLDLENIMKQEA